MNTNDTQTNVPRIDITALAQSLCTPEKRAEWDATAQSLIEDFTPLLYLRTDPKRLNVENPIPKAACDNWKLRPYSESDPKIGLGLIGKTDRAKSRCMFWRLADLVAGTSIEAGAHQCVKEKLAYHKQNQDFYGGARLRFTVTPEDFAIADRNYGTSRWFHQSFPRVTAINAAALSKLIVDASMRNDDNAHKQLQCLYTEQILFIDDLGQAKITEHVGAGLYQIVEERTSSLRPILFTSNFGGDQLVAMFTDESRGAAVVRRLAEFCKVVKV